MSRASMTRTQLAALTLIWGVGTGLWFAPPEMAYEIRGVVRDSLGPGQQGLQVVSDRVDATIQAWRSGIDRTDRARYESMEREAALWRGRALKWQVRSAELRRRLEEEGEACDGPFAAATSQPLLVNRLIEARVLGATRPDLERRLQPIINRGSRHEIDADDLVLADDRPHLDQGADAGLEPDNLVLSGMRVVGRLQEVGRWTSTVQLLTDKEFRGSAQLVRDGADGPVFGAEGILAGNGDGTCRLELVASLAPVSVGDTVFLPSHRTRLPGSICYGRVVEAALTEGAPYWSIRVAPYADAEYGDHLRVLVEAPNPRRLAADTSLTTHDRAHLH